MNAQHFSQPDSSAPPETEAIIRQIIEQIIGDPSQTWRVSDLADEVSLSLRQFERLFHRATGVSPRQFVRTQRLETARQRLLYTKDSIKAVAARSGYLQENHHFERDFKKRFGCTPAEYRRQFQTPEPSA